MARLIRHEILGKHHYKIWIRPDRISGGHGKVYFPDGTDTPWGSPGEAVAVDVGAHRKGTITERDGDSADYDIPEYES